MKYRSIIIPIDLKIIKLLKGKFTYLAVGDAYQAMLLTTIAIASGAHKIIIGLHAGPNYRRFILIKPILTLLNKAGFVKGVHTVNIVDALTLRKILSKIPVWWIPNGVDCRRFKPGTKRGDVFQVLFVGALSEDKGVDTFIETAKIVKSHYNDIKFVIASAGGPLRGLIEKAQKEGIIEFLGFLSDEDIAKLYAESHVAVFPSRGEAFGLVSLEAQVPGTPEITTG